MTTILILALLGLAVFFAVRKMVRDKKNGKSIQCGGDCTKCRGCH